MSKRLINAYYEANKEIQKTIDYLDSIQYVWNKDRTLKLHDLSWKYSSIMDKYPHCKENDTNDEYSYFYRFCEDNYRIYDEEWEENGVKDLFCYVGRTSTFHITNIRSDAYSRKCGEYGKITNWASVLYNITYNASCGDMFDFIDLNENGRICGFNTMCSTNDILWCLEYIASDLYNNTIDYMHNAEVLADEIDDFMNNQVRYFEEWIKSEEDELAYEEEEENRRIEEDKFKLNAIFDSYGVSLEDRKQILALA